VRLLMISRIVSTFDDFLADFHRQHRGWSWRST
jgi:hypothetical protein